MDAKRMVKMNHDYEDNMNRILDYLTRNDQDLDTKSMRVEKMDSYQQDSLLVSTKLS